MLSYPQKAQLGLDAKRAIISALPTFGTNQHVKKIASLPKPEVKAAVMEKIKRNLYRDQTELFGDSVVAEAEEIYEIIVKSYQENIIEIPPIDMVQQEVCVWCERFDLDTVSGFTYQPQGEEIPVVELTGERKIDTIGVRQEAYTKDNPVQQLVSELID